VQNADAKPGEASIETEENTASVGIDHTGIMSETGEISVPVILRISWRQLKKFGLVGDSYLSLQKFR